MATTEALSPTGYMLHHLAHNASGKMSSIIDFSVINYDTIVFSVLMLCIGLWCLYKAAHKATNGVPGKWQCDRPRRPQVHRSGGPDGFRLGDADELHRLGAG